MSVIRDTFGKEPVQYLMVASAIAVPTTAYSTLQWSGAADVHAAVSVLRKLLLLSLEHQPLNWSSDLWAFE